MVRNYIRKKAAPSYSKDDLKNAVREVKIGNLTLYRAAILYKIPKATLFTHVKDKRGKKSKTGGRPCILPYDVELKMANGIKTLEKWGMGLSKNEVLQLIGRYVNENKIETPFKNGIPGNDYFIRFKRDFKLSQKKPQCVEVARKRSMDPFIIYDYFNLLKENIENVPASQIFNIDETSFCLDPSRVKVVGEKGKAAHRTTSGPGRENITVLLGGNAAGEKLPPLVVFKGKNIWDTWISKEEYPGMTYSATSNGWMETETFTNYFENNFLQNIGTEKPVILIYDGHASHISLPLVEKAVDNGVVIIKLPPHSSHLLQPMDLCVFKSLKLAWDTELIKWQRQNYGIRLPKAMFATIISKIWSQTNSEIISKGFEKAGIYPFNNQVIAVEKFDPEAYTRWCNKKNLENIPPEDTAQLMPEAITEEQVDAASIVTVPNILALPSTSYDKTNLPHNNSTSFENLLLQQLKQKPNTAKPGRKRVCTGSEVITSVEAISKMKEKLLEKTPKKNDKRIKKKLEVLEEETDEESAEELQNSEDSIDDIDLEEEIFEETLFEELLDKDFDTLKIGDWIIAKFATKKSFIYYVGQITIIEPCLEAKFARRSGLSSKFIWPNIQDVSLINKDEIHRYLPAPTFDKRGHFQFNITFDRNVN